MTASRLNRRSLFVPMVICTLLHPAMPLVLHLLSRMPLSRQFSETFSDAIGWNVVPLVLLPAIGWAFASRGPFAILALLGILLLIPFIIAAVLTAPALISGERPSSVFGISVAVIWPLFPLWMWAVWRTAMGPKAG